MRSKLLGAVALATVAVLLMSSSPALAGSTTVSDPSGVDYTASGGTADILSVSLASSGSQLSATCTVAFLPPPGGTFPGGAGDTGCRVLFQNRNKQANAATNPVGGCTKVGRGGPSLDWHGASRDGFHFFIGFDVVWTGTQWMYRAVVGEYDPSPVGGLITTTLGTSSGSGWTSSDPYMPYGSSWSVSMSGGSVTVTVDGVVRTSDSLCQEGYFKTAYATVGDTISNMKGLTVARTNVILPVGSPTTCSICPTAPSGGFVAVSDTTAGNSTAGPFGRNIAGIAYTPGLLLPVIGEWSDALSSAERFVLDRRFGVVSMPDTLGPGPTCPWPTFGGLLPSNPLYTPGTGCHIDDDVIARGSFLPEFWETSAGFVL